MRIPVLLPFLLALMLALAGRPADAQETGPGEIVSRQFDAFRADDLDTAFSYASPMIQGYFRTPEVFGRMVAQGYAMVRNPGQVRLLDLREEAGRLVQRVEVIDRKGVLHLLDYQMIETEEGWKINGVTYVEAPPVAV